MYSGLINFKWENIDNYTSEQISYFLFLEGKSMDVISKIRNIDRETVQKHIIDGKIKYRFLAKSRNPKELLSSIARAGKYDKISLISNIDKENKDSLLTYIREKYVEMQGKDKETAIWILGELKDNQGKDILIKASVHKYVNVRRMAISAMGKINDSTFESALLRALEDINPQVISYAIRAFIKMNSKIAVSKIKYIKQSTDKDYLKRLCDEYFNIVGQN
ncbi:HEAT repeat domain-containing protein [Clostridium arbusti]|uniref:HEAT repeat domain-containing protein n=1 Tax=Clostridium arbusti TaxID=1137848 RepID=UPI0002890862|nr:HEAT repeat domain-containing protein [Clostridium arbusti]